MTHEIITKIIKKASQSTCRFKIAAFGFNKKRELVSKGFNTPRFNCKGGGIHAEQKCFSSAKRKGITTIVICRVGNNGDLLPIDPCKKCKKIAKKLNITIKSVH